MPKQTLLRESLILSPHTMAGMPQNTPVLLAFSGGADSRVLLHILAARAAEKGFPLTLAHVNHGIRGEEALRDREFCCRTAKEYGLEICVLDADVPALAAASGCGLEEEARRVRYDYFAKLMREKGIPLLVTAHHADDNLETVLFRICRGTGLRGLGGIAPVRAFASGWLTRPLLRLTRKEILDYCREQALEYVTDSTNADTAYSRNRIRAEVVPVLETLYAHPQDRITAMTEALREDETFLASLAREFLQTHLTSSGLPIEALQKAPVPILRRALAYWIMEQTGREPEQVHLVDLMRLITGECPRAQVALAGDWIAISELGYLKLQLRYQTELLPYSVPLTLGETCLDHAGVRIFVEKVEKQTKINNLSTQSYIILNLFSDIMECGFYWRSRTPGDVILRGGMHRKLRRLYREAAIPPLLRERMPLLCDGEGIVWAPFVGGRDGLPTEGHSYLLRVVLKSEKKKEKDS